MQLPEIVCEELAEYGRALLPNLVEKLLVVGVYLLLRVAIAWEQVAIQHDTVHRAPETP
jgi:hypothetical protein